jgi:hypothetical protein
LPLQLRKRLQFLPYGRSIGSWICLTHKTYTCHTVQKTMYNNEKRTLRKLQRFISTVILL